MKVMVTGGAGYIGSHCVLGLLDKHHDVVVVDNFSTGHKETINNLKNYGNVEFYETDLRRPAQLHDTFQKSGDVDAVMHFAAFSQVGESVRQPEKYYINNVCGTLNLLNEMIKRGVDKIVFSSTAATYGNPKKNIKRISEKQRQMPINPYGTSKFVVEKIMDDYDEAYGLKSVRLRYFNVAGADSKNRVGEWHNPETHVIPMALKNILDKKSFKIFGTNYNTPDKTAIRDYIYIGDLINAHLLALKYLLKGGQTNFFNLGTNSGNSVREIVEACKRLTGKNLRTRDFPRRAGDPERLVANNRKAKEILNWKPEKDLDYSIKTAYEWEQKLRQINHDDDITI